VTEYSRHTETSRARARFLQGRKPIMLYTGRAHFFFRHFIKGARHVIFLGLPDVPEFYSQLVNQLNDGLDKDEDTTTSSLALFTKYDAFALERIVGKDNCNSMLSGEKSTFLFS
jgi:U3 small nucleolar RNA-associated protein 25